MTYYQFVKAVEMNVKEGVEDGISVGLHTAEKNNGVMKCGVILSREGINISPTIYLEEYYQQFQNGITLKRIAEDIIRLYYEVRFEKSWDENRIQTFSEVKDKIVYRVINYQENQNMLLEVPHVRYLDLAVTFHVLLEISQKGTASMMIRNEHLKLWKVTKDEVYGYAKRNTERILPYEFQTMNSVIEELTGEKLQEQEDILYVLSNSIRSYGAATILYERRLESIGEYLQDNYYVLPSSVHEVIILPEQYATDKESLSQMVAEINLTQVQDEEVLENHAYYYDRGKKQLML